MNKRRSTWPLSLLIVAGLALGGVAGGRVALGAPPPASSDKGTGRDQATPRTLPPLPAGLPSYFSFGLYSLDTTWLGASGVPWDLRYNYLTGGVNTSHGWATWESPPGQYALSYITASRTAHTIPVFMYYQILQSGPAYEEFTNLNTPATMYAYYDDFKLLMQKCAQAGGPIFVGIETDLTGRMQVQPSNTANDAGLQPTSVAASGHPDVQGIPDTFRGFYQALAHLRAVYAPNVSLALDLSAWGAGHDVVLALHDDPAYDWLNHATRTAAYLNSLGPGYQVVFYNPLDRDAAYYQLVLNSNRWWDDQNLVQPTFDRMVQWLNQVVVQTNKRAVLWQIPNGNRVYRTMNNSAGHWQDNRAEYFLDPAAGRAHIAQWADAGVVGIMFGEGLNSQTHYFDYANDGITNPPPINGNTAVANYPDDDGGYIRLNTAAYYQGGPIPLPAAGCSIFFSDVLPTAYYYEAVRFLTCQGALSGYADNTFRPANNTTRAQLTKMVTLAEGFPIDPTGGPHFADVPLAHPFYGFIATGVNRGLITGYTCGNAGEPCPGTYFRPGGAVTRAQLTKIIVNAEGWSLVTPATATFRDVPVGVPFYAFVETAYAHGILSGYNCGGGEPCPGLYFRPGNSATRGQIAKILYNAVTVP